MRLWEKVNNITGNESKARFLVEYLNAGAKFIVSSLPEKFLWSVASEIEIYGSGTKKSELIDSAKKYNTKLKIFEPVSNEILVNNLSNYKIYISSSNYEGNPKSVLEAMSKGCIVIAKNNKNVEEIIQNNKNGFLYESNNQLLNYVEFIINDEKLWKEISKSAIDSVIENNSLSKLSDQEYKDYKNLKFSNNS